ncbi:hypothetical protein LINPERHAP2_LOCUS35732 [Linum perenne]
MATIFKKNAHYMIGLNVWGSYNLQQDKRQLSLSLQIYHY